MERTPAQSDAHDRRRWREVIGWLVAVGMLFLWAAGERCIGGMAIEAIYTDTPWWRGTTR